MAESARPPESTFRAGLASSTAFEANALSRADRQRSHSSLLSISSNLTVTSVFLHRPSLEIGLCAAHGMDNPVDS